MIGAFTAVCNAALVENRPHVRLAQSFLVPDVNVAIAV